MSVSIRFDPNVQFAASAPIWSPSGAIEVIEPSWVRGHAR